VNSVQTAGGVVQSRPRRPLSFARARVGDGRNGTTFEEVVMKRGRLGIWAVAVCAMFGILLTFAASVAAQELVTDAERLWRDLRSSSDVRTKLLAERWYHAVKLQEWSNDTGKFTTNAKYLDHDPDLGWVKLRVIQGTGRERVVKEVTIPIAKLSKTCQARVRQIHALSAKLAEAKVEEEKRKAEEKGGAPTSEVRSGEMPAEEPVGDRAGNLRDRRGRGEFADESASVNPEDALTQEPRAERSEPSVPNTPLPALSPSLPTTRIALAIPNGPSATSPETNAVPTGDEAWRTSYDAFRANIHVQDQGRGNYAFQWGPMQALQHAYEVNKRWEDSGDVGQEALAEIGAALDAVGEVNWEATLKAVPAADGDWSEALELPALPEPWELTFMLDEQQDPAVLATLKPGDRVRFTGRFEAFDDSNSIVVPIRFSVDPAASAGVAFPGQRSLDSERR
jgi:hypothetical protein